jgi:hypothetical protein
MDKNNFGKNNKKNHMEKYCNNSQCFFLNYKAKFLISSILKKIKSTKTILGKKYKKTQKIEKKIMLKTL